MTTEKSNNFTAKSLLGIVSIILAYIALLVTGPVSLAGVVVYFLPIVLLVTSAYLFFCNFSFTTNNNYVCRLSNVLESYSGSLTFWMILSFSLIGSQLVIIWGGETLSFFYMGGLLPNGDASSYYKGARRLLTEGDLSEWSSRRPFMTAYLAFVLALVKFSLSASIATISAIAALSIGLFASALRRSEPLAVVLWVFVLVFFFYYRFVGTTLSENLGLTFGGIAFVFLWVAADERNIRFFLMGMLFMTLAQVARSGAVLVLPALIVWGTFWLASGVRARLTAFIGACAAIITGFLLNRLLLEMGGTGIITGFGNFSYTLYGLSIGEGGWSQIVKDHPDIVALSEPARSQGIYALAFNNIIHDPSRLVEALIRNLSLYTIVNGGLNIVTGTKAWLLVHIPTILGVVWCIRYIKTPRYALLLFVLAGVIFSSTIITEDGGLRVFAATIPFSAAIAAVGLQFLARRRETNRDICEEKSRGPVFLTIFLAIVLVSGIFLTILVVPLETGAKSGEKISCGPGARLITILYPARTATHLRRNKQEFARYVPNIYINDFRKSLKSNGRRRDWPNVELLQIPYSMLSLGKYILLPTSLIIDDPSEITICTEKNGWLFIDQRLLLNPL